MNHMKTARIALFLGVLVSSLILGRASLHAQPSSAQVSVDDNDKPWNRGVPLATREAAKNLFLEGNRLFNIPVYTRAAEKYIAALAMWKHPAFYFNLAITQLNLGQDLEARVNLEGALRYGPQALEADRYQEAQKQLKEVEGLLGRIRITCPTEGAEVTLDGATLFIGPGTREEWVIATAHQITARRSEYVTQAKRVIVAAGKIEMLDLPLTKLVEDRPWTVWKPWAVIGTGVAFAAAGGAFHALSARKFAQYDDNFLKLPCASMGCKDDEIRPGMKAQLSRAQLERRLAVGGYIAGGSLIALGAVLVYLNRPHLVEQAATDTRNTVAVVPAFSADTVSVLVTVSR
jgi:tetratricopeptide (TPR) repeat protein